MSDVPPLAVDMPTESLTPLVALFKEKGIRILGTVINPLFCALDVAEHIKDKNHVRTLHAIPDAYIRWGVASDGRGVPRRTRFLTEFGLYRYLLRTKSKLAEPFQHFTYDLLTAERKRTVDDAKLELKIAQSRVKELEKEKSVVHVLRRVGRIELVKVVRTANIARDETRVDEKRIKWLLTGVDDGSDADEISYDNPDAPEEIDPATLTEAPPQETKVATEEEEITPLVKIFEEKKIRVVGTVNEPLFCAADVAQYIKDANSVHFFRHKSSIPYIRWEFIHDAQGQPQKTRFLTEAGMYRYLLSTALPEAEPFQLFTYELLTAERKRTVDDIQLATKIERTRAEELMLRNAAARKEYTRERQELNWCMRSTNEAREVAQKTRARRGRIADARALENELEGIRHYWAPHPPPPEYHVKAKALPQLKKRAGIL